MTRQEIFTAEGMLEVLNARLDISSCFICD